MIYLNYVKSLVLFYWLKFYYIPDKFHVLDANTLRTVDGLLKISLYKGIFKVIWTIERNLVECHKRPDFRTLHLLPVHTCARPLSKSLVCVSYVLSNRLFMTVYIKSYFLKHIFIYLFSWASPYFLLWTGFHLVCIPQVCTLHCTLQHPLMFCTQLFFSMVRW